MLDDILEVIFELVLEGVGDAIDSRELPKPVKNLYRVGYRIDTCRNRIAD